MTNRGEALKARRIHKRMTQVQLSKLSGVDQVTISDIERGITKSPSFDKVVSLSAALECPPQDLFSLPAEAIAS